MLSQIAAEIKPRDIQKECAEIKITAERPRRYYHTTQTDEQEIEEADSKTSIKTAEQNGDALLSEEESYPILAQFVWGEHRLYCKRIDEKRSSNKQGQKKGNKWLHPDIVAMEDLTKDWDDKLKDCVTEYSDKKNQIMVVNVSGAKVINSWKNIAPPDIGSGQGLEFI